MNKEESENEKYIVQAKHENFINVVNSILMVLVMGIFSLMIIYVNCRLELGAYFEILIFTNAIYGVLWGTILVLTKMKKINVTSKQHIIFGFFYSLLYNCSVGIAVYNSSERDIIIIVAMFFVLLVFVAISMATFFPLEAVIVSGYYAFANYVAYQVLHKNIPIYLFGMTSFIIILFFSYKHQKLSVESYLLRQKAIEQSNIVSKLLEKETEYSSTISIYKSIFEQALLSIIVSDSKGEVIYANPYFYRISGYSKEEICGKKLEDINPKDNKETYEEIKKLIKNGESWFGQINSRKKSGERYNESAVIYPVRNSYGDIINYAAIKEDISEKIMVKQELTERTKFISQLLDVIPSVIFYTDRNDFIIGVNRAFNKLFNVESENVENTALKELPWMSKDRVEKYEEMKEEAIERKSESIRYIKMLLDDGRIFSGLYTLTPYYNSDNSMGGMLGIITDITELKEKEIALEEALFRAKEATKAKSLFLANMSHEIRTPMNAIIGMSYLTLKTQLDDKQKDYITKVHSSATLLLGIINDILDFSKIESGKMELESIEFDLDMVLLNALNILAQNAYNKNLGFIYYMPFHTPYMIQGDPLKLGQIITNLVSNAIKFTNEGEIRVEVSELMREKGRVKLQFSVSDTGVGIKKEDTEKLFDAFTQSDSSTTRKFGGTGLGLAICKKIVEKMEGDIWVESEWGKGSKFLFTAWFVEICELKSIVTNVNYDESLCKPIGQSILDDQADEIYASQEKINMNHIYVPEKTFSLKGIQILLVEDNEVNQQITCELLELYGAIVDIAGNGLEAVEKYNGIKKYDLILMDVQMPVMDGNSATRLIRKNDKQIPIIAMTARTFTVEKDECYKAGMNDYVSKPIEPEVFYQTIMKWIEPKVYAEELMILKHAYDDCDLAIEGIDTISGIQRVAGNKTLYINLLKRFGEKYSEIVSDIRKMLDKMEYSKLEYLAHSLKGVSGNIGAIRLQVLFSDLERLSQEGKGALNYDYLINEIAQEMEKVTKSINRIIR